MTETREEYATQSKALQDTLAELERLRKERDDLKAERDALKRQRDLLLDGEPMLGAKVSDV